MIFAVVFQRDMF